MELFKLVTGFPALPGGEYIPATSQDIEAAWRELHPGATVLPAYIQDRSDEIFPIDDDDEPTEEKEQRK